MIKACELGKKGFFFNVFGNDFCYLHKNWLISELVVVNDLKWKFRSLSQS